MRNNPGKKIAILAAIICLVITHAANAQFAWPQRGHDARHTSRTNRLGPQTENAPLKIIRVSHIYADPVVGAEAIFSGTCEQTVIAFANNGQRKWQKTGLINDCAAEIVVGPDGRVYLGSETDYLPSHLLAMTAQGRRLWSRQMIVLGLTVDSSGLYATTVPGNKLVAIGFDGKEKWSRNIGVSPAAPAISNGIVYVGSKDSNLYAFDTSGRLLWKRNVFSPILTGVSIGNDETIYVRSSDGFLHAFSPNNTQKWKRMTGPNRRFDFQNSYLGISEDGTIYVPSMDRHLYAVSPNGKLKWRFRAEESIDYSPVIGSDGAIYFATGKNLYAVSASGSLKFKIPSSMKTISIASDGGILGKVSEGILKVGGK